MIKVCPHCSKEFECFNKNQKYCSADCAYRARLNGNSRRMRATRTEDRKEWAKEEARYLNHLTYECGVDELADYIYNNYNKRRGRK